MKKYVIALALIVFQSLAVMAQNQFEMNVFSNGSKVFTMPTALIDSLKFNNRTAQMHYSGNLWNRSTTAIDSIVFGQIISHDTIYTDTTAIDTTGSIHIHWSDTGVDILNPYAAQGVDISVNGQNVEVTSTLDTDDLIYVLTGNTESGNLKLTSSKKLILFLDGVSITNPNGAAVKMMSDKRVMLHLNASTTNALNDGASSSDKGALQFKGKLDIQGQGILNVHGYAKHGIQSAGKCNIMGGTIHVQTDSKDGLNTDKFVMDGGDLTIVSAGDGIDGDQGYIEINNGNIDITCASADAKGICCDSILTINGGNIMVRMTGDQSKCIKSKQEITINEGKVELHANGSVVLEELGSGFDPSYCVGIKGDSNVYINGGQIVIACPESNSGGKGINADGNIVVNSGNITINALGSCSSYTNEDGIMDDYSSSCLNSDKSVFVSGGLLNLNAVGKAINADGDFVMDGGELNLTTTGNGAVTVGSGTSATDGYTSACIKADGHITINAGRLTGSSTGIGGRGLVAAHFTMGAIGADDDLIDINIYTSGTPVNTNSGGGWGGHGPGGNTDYWKGLPKGIKIDSSIVINSGRVSVYCSQPSGDPTAEAIECKGTITINGGEVEANSHDDAINAAQNIVINGGKVWANARGNDGIDCNGTSVTVNGGLVIVSGTEVGIDADTENGGRFNINGGTIICKGGNMGCWDTPTCTGSQRYITASVTPTTGFAIADQNDNILLIFKAGTFTGSGFIDQTNGTGTKPPPGGGGGSNSGVGITFPGMVQGSYKVYSNVTISGGSDWHGFFSGATCTTSGSATTVNTR